MYNLSSSQADRVRFDEMVARVAQDAFVSIGLDDANQINPPELAQEHWSTSDVRTDDFVEAQARFVDAFVKAWHDHLRDAWAGDLGEELYCKVAGYTTCIEVFPGGQQDGLDYGPVVVDIVVLDNDGDTIAYRLNTDAQNNAWAIGKIEDAADCAIAFREAADNDMP